jgi:hypothetical protein
MSNSAIGQMPMLLLVHIAGLCWMFKRSFGRIQGTFKARCANPKTGSKQRGNRNDQPSAQTRASRIVLSTRNVAVSFVRAFVAPVKKCCFGTHPGFRSQNQNAGSEVESWSSEGVRL